MGNTKLSLEWLELKKGTTSVLRASAMEMLKASVECASAHNADYSRACVIDHKLEESTTILFQRCDHGPDPTPFNGHLSVKTWQV